MSANPDPQSGNYSEEQRQQMAEEFLPVARRYRQIMRWSLYPLIGFVGCIMAAASFSRHDPKVSYVVGAAGAFLVTTLLIKACAPSLVCPGCRQSLDQGHGSYCPVCAHQALRPGKWYSVPECDHCRHRLRRKKGSRRYPIRACTHCGLFLDPKGL